MRLLAIIMSNGATSLVSLMLTVVIGRQDGPSQLGVFGMSYAALSLAQLFAREVGLNRALSSPGDPVQAQTGYSRALVVSLVVAIPMLIVGFVVSNYAVMATAIAVPGHIAFTFLRLVTMTEGRMNRGFVADAVVLGVVAFSSIGVIASGAPSTIVIFAWALSLPVSSWILRKSLGLKLKVSWNSSSKLYSGITFGFQSLFGAGAVHLSTFLLGGLFNSVLVGAIRAGSTLFGPVNLITTSINTITIRQLASASAVNRRGTMIKWFAFSAGIGVVGACATLLTTNYVGSIILGESWPAAEPLVPWMALDAALVAAGVVPRAAHRVDMRGAAAWRVSLFMGVSRLVLLPVGGLWAGATGVATFLALSSLLSSGLWWISYYLYRR